jgi:pyoverdine/dityrosine biosynthesis protein Dit1
MIEVEDFTTQQLVVNLSPTIEKSTEESTENASCLSTPVLEPILSKVENAITILATKALKIIQSYGVNEHADNHDFSVLFLPIVVDHVKKNTPIKMILPAFPAKSPNRVDKVLGHLPDLGEELALAHLDGMCKAISEFYGPGAEVFIASDGIVYSGMTSHSSK